MLSNVYCKTTGANKHDRVTRIKGNVHAGRSQAVFHRQSSRLFKFATFKNKICNLPRVMEHAACRLSADPRSFTAAISVQAGQRKQPVTCPMHERQRHFAINNSLRKKTGTTEIRILFFLPVYLIYDSSKINAETRFNTTDDRQRANGCNTSCQRKLFCACQLPFREN